MGAAVLALLVIGFVWAGVRTLRRGEVQVTRTRKLAGRGVRLLGSLFIFTGLALAAYYVGGGGQVLVVSAFLMGLSGLASLVAVLFVRGTSGD